jgi:hypothetical protein
MNHLGKAGGEELAKALKSKDPDVRAAAERLRATLEGNVKPTTAPAGFKAGGDLAAALASTDPAVRGAALKLKGAIEANTRANTAGSGGAAGTDLAAALASKDPDVRNAALTLKRTIESHTKANTAPKGAAATADLATGLNDKQARQRIVTAARFLVRFINSLLTISPQVTVNARVTQRPTSNRGGAGVRQHGGPVAASSPYIVGEAGPELFVPRVSGHIVPHGPTAAALAGGGDTYQVNIAATVARPDHGHIRDAATPTVRRDGRAAQEATVSNAAAVIGLTFGGSDVQNGTFGIFLEIKSGLVGGVSVRGTDTIVPGLAGRIVRNRKRDRRVIELRGFVTGNAGSTSESSQRSSFRDKWQALEAIFDVSAAAPANLVATLEDGTTATIACRTLDILPGDQPVPTFQEVSVELESVVPDWS